MQGSISEKEPQSSSAATDRSKLIRGQPGIQGDNLWATGVAQGVNMATSECHFKTDE